MLLSRRSATKAVRGLIVAARPKATLATTHQDIPTLPPRVFDYPGKTGASRSNWEDWMVNLRGEDAWLAGPRDLSWYTGQPPMPGLCPGVSLDGAIRALPMPDLNKLTR
ncbi:mug158, partial [Symbiodinium necroappetens]